jgi:hypothetical protein
MLVRSVLALIPIVSFASSFSIPNTPNPLLQPRQDMDTLAEELLAIVNGNGSASTLEARGENELTQTITQNATSLNDIGAQSNNPSLSATIRANLACAAAQLVFVSRVVMPKDTSLYKTEQQENWCVT